MWQFSYSARGGVEMENDHVKAQDSDCELCIHHWLINERNFGVCKKCGETKQFSSGSWYDASIRKPSHTKSGKLSQVVPDTKG